MHPVIFTISGYTIASYGLFVIIGASTVWFYARLLNVLDKPSKAERINLLYTFIICICGAMTGAFLLRPLTRIPEILFNWQAYKRLPSAVILDYLFGEIVFYGALAGGVIALLIYCKRTVTAPLPLLDMFAPALALGHAIGRIGCYLAGCCYGIAVHPSHPLAVRFPGNTAGGAPPGVPVLATQLIEASGLIVICAVLTVVYKKYSQKRKNPGITVCLYGILYGAFRFTLEFYRGDIIRGVYGPFSTSQYISIAVFIISAAYLTILARKYKIAK